MSLGSIIGGVAGGVIGFFIGGPMGAVYGASIGFGIGALVDPMTPDIPSSGAPAPESGEVMTSTVGDPCPDVIGTGKIVGHLLFYGGERSEAIYSDPGVSGGKGGPPEPEPQITGYNYYMSWVLGICAGPVDTLYSIFKNKDLVWEGPLDIPASGGQETIVIEGMGSVTFYFGTSDQVANTTLGALLSDDTLNTPYRNYCWAFFDDCLIGNYPRTPSMSFVLKKIPTDLSAAKSEIQDYDSNPMHAEYYILNTLVGMPSSWLDSTDFVSVASTLYEEFRGMSIVLKNQQSALDYIQSINYHVDNILRYGSDGKFHPKLIRNDYDTDTIVSINEDDMLDDPSLIRKSWIDTVNEVKVQYTEIIATRSKTLYGQLYGTGHNSYGETGTDTFAAVDHLTQSPDASYWRQIAIGHYNALGINTDKELYWWGRDMRNVGTHIATPQILDTESWEYVGCGVTASFAVKSDGTLWGVSPSHYGVSTTWSQIGSDSDWAGVNGGEQWMMAWKTNGDLYGVGRSTFSQFGLDNTTTLYVLTVLPLSGVVKVSCGQYHAVIHCSNGAVYTAGRNYDGECGNGVYSAYQGTFYSLGSYDFASAMDWNTGVIKNGIMYNCGQNYYGEQGHNDTIKRNTLTQVPGTGWKYIAEGKAGRHSLVIKDDGTLWSCGFNNYFQLGINDAVTRHVHAQEDNGYTDWKTVVLGFDTAIATR